MKEDEVGHAVGLWGGEKRSGTFMFGWRKRNIYSGRVRDEGVDT